MTNRLTLTRVVELRHIRASTVMKTRGCELPESFVLATIQAGLNSLERSTVAAKASRRRAVEKAMRVADQPTRPCEAGELDSVEVVSFASPRVPRFTEGENA